VPIVSLDTRNADDVRGLEDVVEVVSLTFKYFKQAVFLGRVQGEAMALRR
jgi:hypothetical protein